jgi:hypothetical protein
VIVLATAHLHLARGYTVVAGRMGTSTHAAHAELVSVHR